APASWLGAGPVLAHNIAFLTAFVLSGAGMYLLVASLTERRAAGIFAGVVFAFLPYRFDHYAHLQLQGAQWMPLALWALHRLFATARPLFAVLAGVFLALNALSCMYYGLFFAMFFPLVALVLLAGAPGRRVVLVKQLALAAVVAVVTVGPFALP